MKSSSFSIDFTTGPLAWRCRQNHGWNEAIVKALKINRHDLPHIVDMTAGLGRDAFLLASLGCSVTALERNADIFKLLQAALEQAKNCPETAEAANRLSLYHLSAESYVNERDALEAPPWGVYLDPMFPAREKTAAVKKESAFLQSVVGFDEDCDALLDYARLLNPKRIVVKRPKGAPFLKDIPPHHQLKQTRLRFDIYFPENLPQEA